MSHLPISEADLQAWVDAVLPEARQAEVDAYLAEYPAELERLQAYRAQKQALLDCFSPVLAEPVPEHLQVSSMPPSPAGKGVASWGAWNSWPVLRLAAAVLLSLFGGMAGWLAHGQYVANAGGVRMVALPRQAAVAHAVFSPDVRRPVEVGGDQEAQLVAWLSKRLGTPVAAPGLRELGYQLVGGRLLPGNSGPVAQFMYQDASGLRLTLYVSTEQAGSGETGFRFAREDGINVFYWIDGKFGYALSGAIAKPDLARVATAVYDQLERK